MNFYILPDIDPKPSTKHVDNVLLASQQAFNYILPQVLKFVSMFSLHFSRSISYRNNKDEQNKN